MTCAKRKIVAWIALAAMLGGTALFVLIAMEKGLPDGRELWINLWPVTTIIGTVVAGRALRRAYKEEPASGFWHLSMGDLLTVSFAFGSMQGITRSLCTELHFGQTMLISALATIVTLSGLLIANRLAFPHRQRFIFGIAFALGTFGLLIVGGFLSVCVVVLIAEGRLNLPLESAWERGTFRTMVVSLFICLPTAVFCYHMARQRLTEEALSRRIPMRSDQPNSVDQQ